MRITIFILPFAFYLLLFDFLALNMANAEEPPVIINRSTEVHNIDGKKYHFHAVLQGQTLYSISQAYGVTEQEVISVNPELEQYGLRYDQLIKIPYAEQPRQVIEEKDFIEHRVKRRETLFSISRQYDVSVDELLRVNPESRRGLKVNQVLLIPKETKEEEPVHKTYEVSPGDTFYSLSRRFDVAIDVILEFNPQLDDGVLRAGQTIKLPLHVSLEPEKETEPGEEELRVEHERELVDREYCKNPNLKEQYNVALLIPLFLEDVVDYYEEGERLPGNHKSLQFLEFYEGMLIAIDSVNKLGANIKLHVYDVCQDTAKALKVVNDPGFKSMDLVIGSFFPRTLRVISEHARENNIPVVSPLLQDREQLKFCQNLFQFTPSLLTQLNELSGYISNKFPTQNVILVHDNQPQVSHIIKEFNDDLNLHISNNRFFDDSLNMARVNGYYLDDSLIGARATNVYVFNDSLLEYFPPPLERKSLESSASVRERYRNYNHIKEVVLRQDGIEGLKDELLENKNNILISLLGGEPVVSNYLRSLSLLADTFDIKVFGVPQWQNYSNLEIDHLQSANVHIISPDFIDYSERNVQDFVTRFREQFDNEPGGYAFKGVETGFYFMNALMTYGKEFSRCMYQVNNRGGYNSIIFEKSAGIDKGWENKRTTIFRYKDYRKIDVRKPSLLDR